MGAAFVSKEHKSWSFISSHTMLLPCKTKNGGTRPPSRMLAEPLMRVVLHEKIIHFGSQTAVTKSHPSPLPVLLASDAEKLDQQLPSLRDLHVPMLVKPRIHRIENAAIDAKFPLQMLRKRQVRQMHNARCCHKPIIASCSALLIRPFCPDSRNAAFTLFTSRSICFCN